MNRYGVIVREQWAWSLHWSLHCGLLYCVVFYCIVCCGGVALYFIVSYCILWLHEVLVFMHTTLEKLVVIVLPHLMIQAMSFRPREILTFFLVNVPPMWQYQLRWLLHRRLLIHFGEQGGLKYPLAPLEVFGDTSSIGYTQSRICVRFCCFIFNLHCVVVDSLLSVTCWGDKSVRWSPLKVFGETSFVVFGFGCARHLRETLNRLRACCDCCLLQSLWIGLCCCRIVCVAAGCLRWGCSLPPVVCVGLVRCRRLFAIVVFAIVE